jgi:SNF2 family DNA or RNA helicase
MEMGTGKTKVAIDWAGIGFHNYGVRKVLVVAPLSVLGVWPRQIRQHSPVPSKIFRLEGPTAVRCQHLARISRVHRTGALDGYLSWIIINYEGIWRAPDRGPSIEDLLRKWKPDLVIFDESHRLKSPTSKQSKAAFRISQEVEQRLILTGTAITKSPLDAFGQFRAIEPKIFGSNWYAFKNTYGLWGGMMRHQLRGYRNVPKLTKLLRENSFRVKKEECLDLPPKVYETVPVVLPDSIMRMYNEMAREMILELKEAPAVAPIVLVKLLRLSQITSGFVKDVEGKIQILDDTKLKTLMSLVEDAVEEDHKVVVFARFVTDISRISQGLTGKKIQHRILSGSVPPHRRDSIIAEFQENPDVRVFVAQTQAGSLGIELTAADIAVFYSLDYNAANYWQAQDRLHRIGQNKKVTYYHLLVPRSIDTVVMKALQDKADIAARILHKPQALIGE